VHFTNSFKTNEISTFVPPIITTGNDSVLYIFEKNISLKNHRKNMKNTSLPKTPLKPTKYQHLHLLGWA